MQMTKEAMRSYQRQRRAKNGCTQLPAKMITHVLVALEAGVLSEGQASELLGMDCVGVRAAIDACKKEAELAWYYFHARQEKKALREKLKAEFQAI